MKSKFNWHYICLCSFALFPVFSMAGIEDIIDETRESEGGAFVCGKYASYSQSMLGHIETAPDFYKKVKSARLIKTESASGLRVKVEELSSRPVLSAELMQYKKPAEGISLEDVMYGLNKPSWSGVWQDVSESVCCYPLALTAKAADGVTYSTVLRSNPTGHVDISYKSIISVLANIKGAEIRGDVSLLIVGLGRGGSNDVSVKISANNVAAILASEK